MIRGSNVLPQRRKGAKRTIQFSVFFLFFASLRLCGKSYLNYIITFD